ncbi:hypothetical protein UPYG_G00040340 [Umbra pygmaea]|uniref:P-type ATPase C-terminal domain-containing protein n=1 Tax=Umbra pygmaea TaxID=75934 RepID=A0ABD0Y5F4_UMBPY
MDRMIQVDVGVGISGQEGMQAVMASDFAMPRFRNLQKLLLVHGHWCYSRLANMILYFFYKNAMFVALIFWYQFHCGFSGSAMIDQWYLIFFNLMFSAFPQLITGTLDKDVSSETLQELPQLYMNGQNSEEYKPYMFWVNMIDAIYQSLVCFFIPYFAYADSDVDLFTWGTPITTLALLTILTHLGIETKTWTWLNWLSIFFSVCLFFTVALCYNASCPSCYSPSSPYWTMQTLLGEPVFYLLCILTPAAALMPRYVYRACQGSLFPSAVHVGRQLDKLPCDIRRNILSLSRVPAGSALGVKMPFLFPLSFHGPFPKDYNLRANASSNTYAFTKRPPGRVDLSLCGEGAQEAQGKDSGRVAEKKVLDEEDQYTLASTETNTLPYTKEVPPSGADAPTGTRAGADPVADTRDVAGADTRDVAGAGAGYGCPRTDDLQAPLTQDYDYQDVTLLDPSELSLSNWITSTPLLGTPLLTTPLLATPQSETIQLTLPLPGGPQSAAYRRNYDDTTPHRLPDHRPLPTAEVSDHTHNQATPTCPKKISSLQTSLL